MSWSYEIPGVDAATDRAERALRWPVGMVSPLWAIYGAAAGAGIAYWWMTHWTRAVNVEAFAPSSAPVLEPPAESPVAEAVIATVEAPIAIAEAAADTISDVELEPLAEAAPEPAVDLAPAADDLTVMSGIGPKLSAALAARGVTSFAQIAAWTAEDVAEVDAALNLRGRAGREAWIAQAKRLAGA